MSVAEEVLKSLARTLTSVAPTLRNTALPERVPIEGLIIIRDGTSTLEAPALGGMGSFYYSHDIEVEVYVQESDAARRDDKFDKLMVKIGQALDDNPTLEGRIFGMSYYRPEAEVEPIEGGAAVKQATLIITVEYEVSKPLD